MVVCRLLRTARWRRTPATDSQKKFVGARWFKRTKATEDGNPPDLSKLTKGEAANIISRIKHGAVVRMPAAYYTVRMRGLMMPALVTP